MTFYQGGLGGRNPVWGRDAGPPPPTNRQAFGVNPFNYPLHYGSTYGTARPFAQVQQAYWGSGAYAPLNNPMAQQAFATSNAEPQVFANPTRLAYPPGSLQPTAYANTGRTQTRQPVVDPSLPAANMTNSTGGVGCEPGYNYFFPSEHAKILVFRTGDTPPWSLPRGFTAPFVSCHVPTNTTVGDLLRGFGACNPDVRKNRVIECHEGGNGVWYKGMSFKGDDVEAMQKQIKDVGWDKTRTGLSGGKPVVHLYVTKG